MNSDSSSPSSFFSTTFLDRISHFLSRSAPKIDKEQLIQKLREAQQLGLFTHDTLSMLEGSLLVSDLHVRDVMIPRAQMTTLKINDGLESWLKTIVESGHSRFPVVNDNKDDILGIFLAKDLLSYFASGQKESAFNMRECLRPAVFIPESKRLNVLLRDFRSSRNHMAIIVDEYGGVAGLVTIEDVIEQIVGEIDDEHDADDQVFVKQYDGETYSVLAMTPIDEFNETFNTHFSDEEFDTINGIILQAFGHLPKKGETIELEGLHFQVARMDGRRIKLLRVKQLTPPASPNTSLLTVQK